MTTIFGIKNCDSIKKTLKWLTTNNISHQFHDYRKLGLSLQLLEEIEQQLGWELLLNKRGTTYRQLSDADKNAMNRETALQHMLAAPAMIKRPVVMHNDQWQVGYNETKLQELFHV